MTFVGVVPDHGDPSRAGVPIEADLGTLEVADTEPSRSSGGVGPGKTFTFAITMGEPDCRRLVARLGGSCGRRPLPPSRQVESFDVQTSEPKRLLTASIFPSAADRIEIAKTTTTNRHLPSAWFMRDDAPDARIEMRCARPTAIRIVAVPLRAHPICAPHHTTYRLLLSSPHRYSPTVFLNQVTRLHADLAARYAEISLEQGHLSVEGVASESLDRPSAVILRADHRHLLNLGLEDAVNAPQLWVSGEVASATVGGEQRVGSWLDRHASIFWPFLVLYLTLLVPPLYLLGRRDKTN